MAGLTFYSNQNINFKSKIFYTKLILFWISIVLEFIFCILMILNLSISDEETEFSLVDSISSIATILFISVSLAKIITVFYYRQFVTVILDKLNNLFPENDEVQIKHKVAFQTNRVNKLMQWYGMSTIIVNIIKNVGPIILWIVALLKGETYIKEFQYAIWCPHNKLPTGIFVLIYLIIFAITTHNVIESCAIDILLCTVATQICMHFKILHYEIDQFSNINEKEDKIQLSQFVYSHTELIKLSRIFDSLYSIPMLANFMYSTFMLCISGFLSMYTDSTVDLFVFFLLFVSITIQLLILCWFGNEISRTVSVTT